MKSSFTDENLYLKPVIYHHHIRSMREIQMTLKDFHFILEWDETREFSVIQKSPG